MKMQKGFTLAEVLIALFILATSMFIFSELQVKSMLRVWQGRQDIDRLYTIKKYLYKMYLEPKKARKHTQTFSDPEVRVSVEPRPIHKKSSLFPLNKYLHLVTSQGSWERGGKDRTIGIVSMVEYVPEESS